MPSEVILPRVDMDMATGKISKWLVEPGAAISKGQPLFEIETDKATMEIEAEAAGTIRDLVDAGAADIPVGSVVAWIDAAGEAPSKPAVPAPASTAAAPKPAPAAAAPEPNSSVAQPTLGGRARATPLARRLARDAKLDLHALRGSGPRGRVQAADVLAGLQSTTNADAAPALSRSPAREATREKAPALHQEAAGSGLQQLRQGSGTPLLLVHGFGAEANTWRPFLQGPSLGRPVLAIDLPGHGEAASPSIGSFDDLVDAVEASLSATPGPVDVVAHSLGAAVMTAVAARGGMAIRSLLLLAPAGLGPDINSAFLRGFVDATSEASLTPWMRQLVADPQIITSVFVRATLQARQGTDRVHAQRRLADAVFPDGTQSFSIRADLARLRIPTRIVFGTSDEIISPRHARGLPPLVALHLLPGIGHMPQVEARDTVTAIMGQMGAP